MYFDITVIKANFYVRLHTVPNKATPMPRFSSALEKEQTQEDLQVKIGHVVEELKKT